MEKPLIFNKVFIENEIKDSLIVTNTLKHLNLSILDESVRIIPKYDDIFGQVKKPYLQKRTNLNLFLAKKKGTLVKEAPNAYGLNNAKHFYFINSYNCIYECQYCYLQGFFHSPDIVLFTNHEDILNEIKNTASNYKDCWFHAGEFSDSLALNNYTQELPLYYDAFKEIGNATLELRTKSVNVKAILKQSPLENIITSFSISPSKIAKTIELKVPSVKHRILAMKKLVEAGHPIAIHFDPIIYSPQWFTEYDHLINSINNEFSIGHVKYISTGVVRFTGDVFYQFKKNYPDSLITKSELTKSFDGKVRYPRPMRKKILREISELLESYGYPRDKIYQCME